MLRARLISALVLIPFVVFVVWLGRPYFDGLVAFCGGVLAWEWGRLTERDRPGPATAVAILGVVGSVAAFLTAGPWPAVAILGLAAMCGVAAQVVRGVRRGAWMALGGPFYLGLPCLAMLWLRADPDRGFLTVMWVLVLVWAVDSAAYAAGRAIGGPRLAPAVSPRKTWAGLAGGIAAGAAVGLVFAALVESASPAPLAAAGAGLALVEQAGDLVESAIKRRFNVKDTGSLIPGHGGLLDRVDGLMTVSLAVAALSMGGARHFLP